MEYRETEHDTFVVRIARGQLLMEQLKLFIEKEQVRSAWISGIGGAAWVELGFYNLEEQSYSWERFDAPVEINQLSGNIAYESSGELYIHLHGTFSDASFHSIGGHVTDLEVAGTCELLVKVFDDELPRSLDETVGLKLFNFADRPHG